MDYYKHVMEACKKYRPVLERFLPGFIGSAARRPFTIFKKHSLEHLRWCVYLHMLWAPSLCMHLNREAIVLVKKFYVSVLIFHEHHSFNQTCSFASDSDKRLSGSCSKRLRTRSWACVFYSIMSYMYFILWRHRHGRVFLPGENDSFKSPVLFSEFCCF